MKQRPLLILAAALVAAVAPPTRAASAEHSLDDYRRFRALSIDLAGRAPTRAELAEMESPGFDLDKWIDAHLEGPAYVERLERIYMDQLRLEVGPAFQFTPPATTLHRETILGPDGKPIWVYYRQNQRRARVETDGEFCLSQAETGQLFPNNQPPRGTAIPVKQKAIDAATVLVRPWWIYRDYRAASPKQRYGLDWGSEASGYALIKEMVFEPDGITPTTEVRVCREEAQAAEIGHIYASGRGAPVKPPPKKGAPAKPGKVPPPPPPKPVPPPVAPMVNGAKPMDGMGGLAKAPVAMGGTPKPPALQDRLKPPPGDNPYAVQHKGEEVSCRGVVAETMTIDCGCGAGLEHCLPGDGFAQDPRAFSFPTHIPLGLDLPFASGAQNASSWNKLWWSQEARHFFTRLFGTDRDFREVLTGRWSAVNGPLAQFYRSGALASCCGRERQFKMMDESEPLFRPAAVPTDLLPMDTDKWEDVADRGPHAAGLLTMPAFLAKYASRRARGAAVYSSFLCKSFVADHVDLKPSTEPNLMVREGCSTCHATLEPLAAYFSRVEETNWVFLPKEQFPVENPVCKKNAQGKMPGFCDFFYDGAFSDAKAGSLRGAYAAPDHAERGPAGIAADVTAQPEFASCAVERVASSFLGRPVRDDDARLLESLRGTFVSSGYRMRPLVKALVRSSAYLSANDDRSSLRAPVTLGTAPVAAPPMGAP